MTQLPLPQGADFPPEHQHGPQHMDLMVPHRRRLARPHGAGKRICRKVDSNSLLPTIGGIFRAHAFQYMVWHTNFATDPRAIEESNNARGR